MKTAAGIWAEYLTAQKIEVLGVTTRASELARQLLEAFDPAKDGGIIADLEARKLELRAIHDTRASELADVLWRTITTLRERIALAAPAPPEAFLQGHSVG